MPALPLNAGEQSPATLRTRLEDEIERLIGLLDAIDGDENMEDLREDDEPSVSLTICAYGSGRMETDLELVDEDGDELDHGEGEGEAMYA